MHTQSLSHFQLFVTTWTVTCQAFLSMAFSRQKYWSGLPSPTPWALPDPEMEHESPESSGLAGRCIATVPPCCHCCSVTRSWPTLCDPVDCSTPGSPVLPCLPEFAQTHVHWVSDAMKLSHPLSPSPLPALFPSIRKWIPMSWVLASGSQSIGASVLLITIPGWFPLGLAGLISLQSKELKSLLQHHNLKASIL